MYSPDRRKAFEIMLAFLQRMKLYDQCQKTLVVDEKCNIVLEDWSVIEVPRIYDDFSWANMWDAGVATARYEKVVYLDSDRLLPPDFLGQIEKNILDNVFVFTSPHYQLLQEMTDLECQDLANKAETGEIFQTVGKVRFEPRLQVPVHGPGKNVMSGSTGFTKRTYYAVGGVDSWYRGHGAFADTDFHWAAHFQGCKFVDLMMPELHYHHAKRNVQGKKLDVYTLKSMNVDNFVYYCVKWKVPIVLAEGMAAESGIRNPTKYVQQKKKEIVQELKAFSRGS